MKITYDKTGKVIEINFAKNDDQKAFWDGMITREKEITIREKEATEREKEATKRYELWLKTVYGYGFIGFNGQVTTEK